MKNHLKYTNDDKKKNNFAMGKLNDNIDHNNVVIIWTSLCLLMK